MKIRISPGSSAGDADLTTAQPPLRLNLPIRFGGGSAVGGSSRQVEALRAIAAAVALEAPEDALKKVKAARDDPSKVIEPKLNETELAKIVSAIDSARGTVSGSSPADEVVVAARAIGADPKLVEAVRAIIEKSSSARVNGLNWVAAVNVDLLERAAKAGTREKLLDKHVPVPKKTGTRLEKQVNALEDRIKKLERGAGKAASGARRPPTSKKTSPTTPSPKAGPTTPSTKTGPTPP